MEEKTKREFAISIVHLFNEYDGLLRENSSVIEAMFMLEMTKIKTAEQLVERLDLIHRRLGTLIGEKKSEIMTKLGEPKWFSLPTKIPSEANKK